MIALIVTDNPKTRIPVTLCSPTPQGLVKVDVFLDIELIDVQEYEKIYNEMTDPEANIAPGENLDTRLLKRCVVGWDGFGTSATDELVFNQDNLNKLCKHAWISGPCSLAISDALAGRSQAIEKN